MPRTTIRLALWAALAASVGEGYAASAPAPVACDSCADGGCGATALDDCTACAEECSPCPPFCQCPQCLYAHPEHCRCFTCRSWDPWGGMEYLMWWTKGRYLPPLVTTNPPGTPRNAGGLPVAGTIGQDFTRIVFGDEQVGEGVQTGGRFTVGLWLDPHRTLGVGGNFFILEGAGASFFESSPDGATTIGRPFFNAQFGYDDALLVSYIDPDTGPLNAGSILVGSHNDIYNIDAYLRFMVHEAQGYRCDVLTGFQHSRIDDTLQIDTTINTLDPPGDTFEIVDLFDTRNKYYAATLGLQSEFHYRCWTLKTLAKVGVGKMRQTTTIQGVTTTTPAEGDPTTRPEGFLALGTNIGVYRQDLTSVSPELGMTLAYALTECCSLSIGYSAMYWNRVALAGDQIDTSLNLSQLGGVPPVGEARPIFTFRDTDFWAQGMTFGFHMCY